MTSACQKLRSLLPHNIDVRSGALHSTTSRHFHRSCFADFWQITMHDDQSGSGMPVLIDGAASPVVEAGITNWIGDWTE